MYFSVSKNVIFKIAKCIFLFQNVIFQIAKGICHFAFLEEETSFQNIFNWRVFQNLCIATRYFLSNSKQFLTFSQMCFWSKHIFDRLKKCESFLCKLFDASRNFDLSRSLNLDGTCFQPSLSIDGLTASKTLQIPSSTHYTHYTHNTHNTHYTQYNH